VSPGQEIVDSEGTVPWRVVVMKFPRVLDVASAARNSPFQSFEHFQVESCVHSGPGRYEFVMDNASDVKEDNEHGFDPGLANTCLLGAWRCWGLPLWTLPFCFRVILKKP